jgi:hypothetical protein
MEELSNLLVFIVFGIIVVTFISVVGAIASRKFNFNYGKLATLSRILYFIIAYGISLESNLIVTIAGTFLVGIYDGLVGYQLAQRFNANWGEHKISVQNMSVSNRLVIMLVTCLTLALFGWLLSGR